jgi:Caudovirus prohead serine protease
MGKQVYELMKGRRVKEFSFGYDPTDFSMDGDVRHLNAVDLWELGPTLKGANPETMLDSVKAAAKHTSQDASRSAEPVGGHDDTEGTESPVLVVPDDGNDDGNDDLERDTKQAIAPHKTATDDGAWDGPAQWAALNATEANLRGACAWVDPDGDAETQAAYKFIHHFIGADGSPGAASTRGCTASVAILNGGRGGANVPVDDRQGIYNHVAKHLRDAGVDPIPELQSKSLKVGRVLSAKNEADLTDARDLITKVLASVQRDDQADKDKRARTGSAASREDPTPKSLGQMLYDIDMLELGGLDDHA